MLSVLGVLCMLGLMLSVCLQAKHTEENSASWGVNGETGTLADMSALGIVEPLAVKAQTYKTAVEVLTPTLALILVLTTTLVLTLTLPLTLVLTLALNPGVPLGQMALY